MNLVRRAVAGLLAALLGLNALAMLGRPSSWYGAVPGVLLTGPFNPHFVRDIGAIYLVSAATLAGFAFRARLVQGALVASAAWLALHAVIHLADAVTCGRPPLNEIARDLAGVHLPAILTAWVAFSRDTRDSA